MATVAAGRDLLFGVLALQMDFIGREALIAAVSAWVLDKSRPLDEILERQGALAPGDRALLEPLVRRHLERHGDDPARSLAAAGATTSGLDALAAVPDPDVQATLTRFAPAVAERTETRAVAATGADGSRFRVLRPHARGGLGEVFVALDGELHREVALKEIQGRYADDRESRARFVREAEITGGLEHPGVVPVYGLGHHPDGRPYYAMRFVRGDSLKEAIERFHRDDRPGRDPGERDLALRRLLGRFVDVCNAVAYAHSRGVLHRDLKPGNVMLGPYGETLVVDWGLAKAVGRGDEAEGTDERTLRPSSGDDSAPTQVGAAIGTPAYMSPEQASGQLDRLGPASDVYSLGATLYCLLTRRPPVEGADVGDVLRRVRAGEFPPPRQVARALPPALEAICLKAMAREPGGRYGSPRALAEDIERFLADEPVSARRDSAAARLGRWARRHRAWVASGAAALALIAVAAATAAVLIGGARDRERAARIQAGRALEAETRALAEVRRALAAETRAKAEAAENFARARRAVADYLTAVSQSLDLRRDLPGLHKLRADLLGKARAYYEDFLREHAADPDLKVEAAEAYYQVGLVTGEIGSQAEAIRALTRARDLNEEIVRSRPGDPDARRALGSSYDRLAAIQYGGGSRAEAEGNSRRACAILRRLVGDRPGDRATLRELAHACVNRGVVLMDLGRAAAAEAAFREAISALSGPTAPPRSDAPGRDILIKALGNLAGEQTKAGRNGEALDSLLRAVGLVREQVADSPRDAEARMLLAMTLGNLAFVRRTVGQQDRASRDDREALALQEEVVAENPGVSRYQIDLARTHLNIGFAHARTGRASEAETSYTKAIARLEALLARHPSLTEARQGLALAYNNLGASLGRSGRHDQALDSYRRGREHLARLTAERPSAPELRCALVKHDLNVGGDLIQLDRLAEAKASLDRAIGEGRALAAGYPENLDFRRGLGMAYYHRGIAGNRAHRGPEAERDFLRAEAIQSELARRFPEVPVFGYDLGDTWSCLGDVRNELGRGDEAIAAYERAVAMFDRVAAGMPSDPRIRSRRDWSLDGLAELHLAGGRTGPAAAAALARLDDPPDDPEKRLRAARQLARCASLAARARAAEADRYAVAAVRALRGAVASGLRDVARLGTDRAFAPLVDRADFRALVGDLPLPADPFAR